MFYKFVMGSCNIFIKKENRKFYFICDYYGLNKVIYKDVMLVLKVDDIFYRVVYGIIFIGIDFFNV